MAQVEAEIARRSAARINRFLSARTDLSPACRELAREQRDDYLQTVHCIEQALRIDADRRSNVGVIPAFGSYIRFLKRAEA